MSENVLDLEPTIVWKYFREISNIPRCSKHEDAISDYIVSVAGKFGLDHERDHVGNIVVRKPATAGYDNAGTVVLQAHMDMVCEKNSSKEHDFSKDPIDFVIKEEWLYADGTTLGADNGIGVATMLAIMEDSNLVHGPLEFLITTDEETGMTGAFGLTGDLLKGRILLNLDSEEEGTVYIGCAGGGDTHFKIPLKTVNIEDPGLKAVNVHVHGLKGGHSGVDVHEGRANANKVLARVLDHGRKGTTNSVLLSGLHGGSKRNAIPRESGGIVVMDGDDLDGFLKGAQKEADNIAFEYKSMEPDFKVDLEVTSCPDSAADRESSITIIRSMNALPNGVLAMSLDIPDLVETSTNMGVIQQKQEVMEIIFSTRSSITSALEMGRNMISAVAELAGAEAVKFDTYPGWKPDLDSHILKIVAKVHEEELGKAPELKAIHAGLECGLIKEKCPGMDAVSIGPQIEHPHSPTERVNIPSVARFYTFVLGVLKAVGEEGQ